ncbi:MAG: hypothetical protein KJ062_15970 [Thermoanaerobaculia bacterium]|nr:hypothetical protein [Thermoanaerobaculia bacterium]
MRREFRSYLDLGFVDEAREAPRKEASHLEATGAHRREPVRPAAPMASPAPGGVARTVFWLVGGLLVLFLAGVTFFVLVSPSATPGGGHSGRVHRKMARKAAAPTPTAISAPEPAPAPPPPFDEGPSVGGGPGGVDTAPPRPSPPAPSPRTLPVSVATLVGVLLGATAAVGALSALVGLLRRLKNPLYWQLACWMLVVVGIAVRPVVVSASGLPTPGQLLVSIAVGLAVLPGLMRWLNRVSPKPGLQHVAVPFSLGFFLDLTQVLAASFDVKLPWIPS